MALNIGVVKTDSVPSEGVGANRFDAGSQSGSARQTLPEYKTLVKVSTIPDAALASIALATGHAFIAGGIAGGLVIALVMYAGIYSFVNGSATLALGTIGGRANASSAPMMPMFALVSVLKFVVLAVLLFVLFRVLHIGLVAFVVGFLAAQIAITMACIKSLVAKPLIEKR